MKVKRLIEILQDCNPDVPVYIYPHREILPEGKDRLEILEVEDYCGTTLESLGIYLTIKGQTYGGTK